MASIRESQQLDIEQRYFNITSWLNTRFGDLLAFDEGANLDSLTASEVCESIQLGGFNVKIVVAGSRTLVVPNSLLWIDEKPVTGVVLPISHDIESSNVKAIRAKLDELLKDLLLVDQRRPSHWPLA